MNLPDELKFIENRNKPIHVSSFSCKHKTILLSGATSGIGLETAHRLAQDQAHLLLLVRNEEKGKALQKELMETYHASVDVVLANFESLTSLKKAAQEIQKQVEKLDIVIHNAGIHSTKRILTSEGIELGFMVNYLASFYLTQQLRPLLKKGNHPLVLYINSEGHRFSQWDFKDPFFMKRRYTGLKGYGSSKTAQLLSILALKEEYLKDSIRLLAMHPGDVKSSIGSNNGILYRTFSKVFIQPFLRNPKQSALAIHSLCVDPMYEDKTGLFYHLTHEEIPAPHARDVKNAQRLMEFSQSLITSI